LRWLKYQCLLFKGEKVELEVTEIPLFILCLTEIAVYKGKNLIFFYIFIFNVFIIVLFFIIFLFVLFSIIFWLILKEKKLDIFAVLPCWKLIENFVNVKSRN